jgi:DNA polymerase-3 subunit gamma/tau
VPAARPAAPAAVAAASAEPPRPPARPGTALTIQHVRDAWPEILETVQRAKRSAWAVVYTSYPLALTDDVLTLAFLSRSDVEGFKRPVQTGGGVSEVLRAAILEVLGVRVKFLPRVDGAARPAAPSVAGAPVGDTPPDDPDDVPPPPDPVVERPAAARVPPVPAPVAVAAAAPAVVAPAVSEPLPPAGWGSVAPAPEPEPEPQPEPEQSAPVAPVAAVPVVPVRADEAQRYGESVVRELLGASFLEETVIAPSEVR